MLYLLDREYMTFRIGFRRDRKDRGTLLASKKEGSLCNGCFCVTVASTCSTAISICLLYLQARVKQTGKGKAEDSQEGEEMRGFLCLRQG
jgi:hypothetical protein